MHSVNQHMHTHVYMNMCVYPPLYIHVVGEEDMQKSVRAQLWYHFYNHFYTCPVAVPNSGHICTCMRCCGYWLNTDIKACFAADITQLVVLWTGTYTGGHGVSTAAFSPNSTGERRECGRDPESSLCSIQSTATHSPSRSVIPCVVNIPSLTAPTFKPQACQINRGSLLSPPPSHPPSPSPA